MSVRAERAETEAGVREATTSRIQRTLTAAAWVAAMALAAACVAPLPDVASDEGSAGTGGSGGEAGAGGEGGTGGDGKCAPECPVGAACTAGGECASGYCGATSQRCVEGACHDEVEDGDETATDCGGSCGATCAIGEPCNGPDDCGSRNCVSGRCADSGLPYCQLDSDTATLDHCQLQ